ncbi:MAG: hypothetical protein DRG83_17440 [Deltaproteobacteria bacterium]|nr:MAG: hypothetical protein DRG83_17440 [Deltaproteobacteria bacterium]
MDFIKALPCGETRCFHDHQKQDVKKVTRYPYIESGVFLSRGISGFYPIFYFLISHIFCDVIT